MHRNSLFTLVAGLGLVLMLVAVSPAPLTEARGAAACDPLVRQVRQSLTSGDGLDAAALMALRDCLATSGSFGGSAAASNQDVQSAAVVGSFLVTDLNLCLHFNDDKTVSSEDATWHVESGNYIGVPNIFTIFRYSGSFYLAGFSAFGITFGPNLVQLLTVGGLPAIQTGSMATC